MVGKPCSKVRRVGGGGLSRKKREKGEGKR